MSFEDLESFLRDIALRRKLLLLDTCESGAMDDVTRLELLAKMQGMGLTARTSPVVQQAHEEQPKRVFLYERDRYIYNDLTRRTGAIIFSSSHAGEVSIESSLVQNGLFTHEIVEALGSEFNHTQFSKINSTAEFNPSTGQQINTQFGQVTAARDPRQLQLSARISF